MSSFEDIWNSILSTIREGDIVLNWGEVRGYTGRTFEVNLVHRSWIGVRGGKMTVPRNISRAEFQKIHAIWDDYVAGNYHRAKMGALSQNTSCILSILHRVKS